MNSWKDTTNDTIYSHWEAHSQLMMFTDKTDMKITIFYEKWGDVYCNFETY